MGPTAVTALIRSFWFLAIVLALITGAFLTHPPDHPLKGLNTFERPWGILEIGVWCIPVLVSGGLRLWLHWLRRPWAVLIVYSIGLFFAWYMGMVGIFIVPNWCIVYQVTSAVLGLFYFPWFVRVGKPAPPTNSSSAGPPLPPTRTY